MQKIAFYYSFSWGQIFKHLFSLDVQLEVCCRVAYCYGCQHSVWLVALKNALSNVLGPCQENHFGSRCFKWCLFVWAREHALHKNRLAVPLKRICITFTNSRDEAVCTAAQTKGHLNMQRFSLHRTCKSNLNTQVRAKFENMIATKGRRSQFILPTCRGRCRLG